MEQTRSAPTVKEPPSSPSSGGQYSWPLFDARSPGFSDLYPNGEQKARKIPPGCDVRRDKIRTDVSLETKSSVESTVGVAESDDATPSLSLGTRLDDTLRDIQQRIATLEALHSSEETSLTRSVQPIEPETRITLGKVDGEAVMGIVAGLIHELESDPEREAHLIRRVEQDLVRHGLATPDQLEPEPNNRNYVTVEVAAARLGITINGVRRILAKAGDRVATKHDEAFVPIEKLFIDLDDLTAYRDKNPRGRPTKKKN